MSEQAVRAATMAGLSFGVGATVGHYTGSVVSAWIGVALGIILVMYLDSRR